MFRNLLKIILSTSTMVLPIFISGVVLAQDPPSVAVEQGALAWNNWTKVDAGGTGALPADVTNKDYIRCKACHGWDRLGTDGGYVRRSRKDTRPNAGADDGDSTSRAVPAMATSDMILHSGTGRSFAEGDGSWVALNDMGMHHSNNKAEHAAGYTLGNQHPDFSGGELTQAQIDNLTAFLNFQDGAWSAYFSNINPNQNPVLYTIIDTADAMAGESFYTSNCSVCHGDPATDHQGANGGAPTGGILAYLTGDGKFSEISHAARWGIPDTIMNRGGVMGSPTSQNIADMMLYLQELGGTGFAINPGLSGNWWGGETRDGEGFLVDVSYNLSDETVIVVSFYTYDSLGNQTWLIGAGKIDGNTAEITMKIPEGAMWGAAFDPADLASPRTPWGTGTFTFTSCGKGNAALVPNMDMQGRGFTDLSYDINRDILIPGITCPK